MLSWAFSFLIIILLAGFVGLSGLGNTASPPWIPLAVFLALFGVSLLAGRKRRHPGP